MIVKWLMASKKKHQSKYLTSKRMWETIKWAKKEYKQMNEIKKTIQDMKKEINNDIETLKKINPK
jgi:hypothetical protein